MMRKNLILTETEREYLKDQEEFKKERGDSYAGTVRHRLKNKARNLSELVESVLGDIDLVTRNILLTGQGKYDSNIENAEKIHEELVRQFGLKLAVISQFKGYEAFEKAIIVALENLPPKYAENLVDTLEDRYKESEDNFDELIEILGVRKAKVDILKEKLRNMGEKTEYITYTEYQKILSSCEVENINQLIELSDKEVSEAFKDVLGSEEIEKRIEMLDERQKMFRAIGNSEIKEKIVLILIKEEEMTLSQIRREVFDIEQNKGVFSKYSYNLDSKSLGGYNRILRNIGQKLEGCGVISLSEDGEKWAIEEEAMFLESHLDSDFWLQQSRVR